MRESRILFLTDINKNDYRPWYAIGQCYEMLKMYSYSIYYHLNAHKLRYVIL